MSERLANLQPMTVNVARQLASAANRAKTLEADGYTIERWKSQPQRFWVRKPDGSREYLVNVDRQTCTCKFWEQHHTCKHFLAVLQRDAEDQMMDEAARWYEETEDGRMVMQYA